MAKSNEPKARLIQRSIPINIYDGELLYPDRDVKVFLKSMFEHANYVGLVMQANIEVKFIVRER